MQHHSNAGNFADLPIAAQVAIGATAFNSWVLIAEFVIDRYGFASYLPFYRYANLCVWDAAVVAIIVTMIMVARHKS